MVKGVTRKVCTKISFAATSKRSFVMTVFNFSALIKSTHLESISPEYDLYRQGFMAFNIF